MEYKQICFTSTYKKGWGIPCSSDGDPSAKSAYESIQQYNSKLKGKSVVTELKSSGDYTFFSKINYAATDSGGRRCFFAHAFYCTSEEFAKSPMELIGISNKFFMFSQAEVELNIKKTPSLRDTISLEQASMNLDSDKDILKSLVLCIYNIITKSDRKTVFIIGENNDEFRMSVLTIIYNAFPYAFRKQISFTTEEEEAGNHTIVFANKPRKKYDGYYFSFLNGERRSDFNIGEVNSQLSENSFLTKLFDYDFDSDRINKYFDDLQDKLKALGVPDTLSLEDYIVANGLVDPVSTKSETEKRNWLYSLLHFSGNGSEINKEIKDTFTIINKDGISVGDDLLAILKKKAEDDHDQEITEMLETYSDNTLREDVKELYTKEHDAAVSALLNKYPYKVGDDYKRIIRFLQSDERGKRILDDYFRNVVTRIDFDNFQDFFADIETIFWGNQPEDRAFRENIKTKVQDLIKNEAKKNTSKSDIAGYIAKCQSLIDRIVEGNHEDRLIVEESLSEAIKSSFWAAFDYFDFKFKNRAEYLGRLALESNDKYTKLKRVFDAFDAFTAFANNASDISEKPLIEALTKEIEERLSDAKKFDTPKSIIEKISDSFVSSEATEDSSHSRQWLPGFLPKKRKDTKQ